MASTLPSAFRNWDDVPPDLTILLPVMVPPVIAPDEVFTELGVIAPNVSVIAGVVEALATEPLTPLAVTTDTDETVPPPPMVAQVLSPRR